MGGYSSSQTVQNGTWKSDAWYAMESGTYCVICGGPFDIEGDIYNQDPKEPRYQWLFNFRLLAHIKDMDTHRVTSGHAEPLNTSGIDDIFLSDKASFNTAGSSTFEILDETRTVDIWYNALWCSRGSTGTLFALHEACIQTSCRAIDHIREQKGSVLTQPTLSILYHFLNSRFLERREESDQGPELSSYLAEANEMENDLFDLCHRSIHGPRSVLAMSRLEWSGGEYDGFYANPTDIPELGSFILDILQGSPNEARRTTRPLVSARAPYGIERLPTELLDIICTYLPTQSVIKLHRVSKSLATNLPLDNAFWCNSLRVGSLHPHIWGVDTQAIQKLCQKSNVILSADDWNWRSAAKLLSMKQFPIIERDPRLDSLPLGLWNRCRIWNTIETYLDLSVLEMLMLTRSDSGEGLEMDGASE